MAEAVTTCYRHNDRRAGVMCQRCGRPICPSCMVQASVGFQCPECSKQGAKASPTLTARAVLNRRPIVTEVLIGLNVAAFVAVLATGGTIGSGGGTFSDRFALIGHGSLSPGGPLLGVSAGEWYRLFTGAFVHAGLIHLGMNMLVLWIIGTQLERIVGAPRYIALYIVSAVAGSFAVMLFEPVSYTVGASGAIFGLLGAAAAYQHSRGINMLQSGLAGLIVLNLIFTFAVPNISIGGHIGGLIGGLAGFLMFRLEDRQPSPWPAVALAAAMTGALVLGGVWAAGHWAHPIL